MSQPVAISSIQVTLADGTVLTFDSEEMLPGANYSVSRNFTRPPRKREKDASKVEAVTWLSHNIHFLTEFEPQINWLQRHTEE